MGERKESGTRSAGFFLSDMTAFQSRVNSIWFGVRITFLALCHNCRKNVPREQRWLLSDYPQTVSVNDQRLVLFNEVRNHLFQCVNHDRMTTRSRSDDNGIDSIEERNDGVIVRFTYLLELIALFGTILQLNHRTHNQLWGIALNRNPRFFGTHNRDKIGSLSNQSNNQRLRHAEQRFQHKMELPCTHDIRR